MSDEIRINRPVQPAQPAVAATQPASGEPVKSSKLPWLILAVVVVVLVVLGVLFRGKLFGKGEGAPVAQTGKASGYQAVFLTNGQVYFGKISNANDEWVTLKDIYYLQVIQPPLQGQQEADQAQAQAQAQPQISLVKLGNELHGPVDQMHIARNQILFYEDMKGEGQVVKAIEQYKANPQGTGAPAAQQQAPAPAQ